MRAAGDLSLDVVTLVVTEAFSEGPERRPSLAGENYLSLYLFLISPSCEPRL